MKRWLAIVGLTTAVATGMVTAAAAQAQQDSSVATLSNAQRPMVTRAQLEAALAEIDQDLKSGAYSAALRASKSTEADAIRNRLTQGDFHVGDVVSLRVQGDSTFNGDYTIDSNGAMRLRDGTEISLRGLLHSEVQAYLNQKFSVWVHDPRVIVTVSLRVTILGAINKPGFFYVHADWLLNEVLMQASGGPAANARIDHSKIKRGDTVIVDGQAFADAIRRGRTMDELNIQNGDEIDVAASPPGGMFLRIVGAATAIGGLAWLVIRVF